MSEQLITSLPLIDISPFLQHPSNPDHQSKTAAEIHEACTSTGFFYLTGHGIPTHLFSDVLNATRSFLLNATEEEKESLSIASNDFARGYQRKGLNITQGKADWHEALDLYAPSPFGNEGKGKVLGGENRWPETPKDFKELISQYIVTMIRLGEVMMRATGMGLGLEPDEVEDLVNLAKDSFWVMRCIGYPPLPHTHDGVSCGAHKDYGCYTFLYADSTRGALQVFRRGAQTRSTESLTEEEGEAGVWVNADPIEGALVVNIGEMWEIWTNGVYKATLHRVIHKGQNYRVSIPFFYEPAFNAYISPLPSIIRQAKENDKPVKERASIRYGDFLLSKVGGNFTVSAQTGQPELNGVEGEVRKGRY
ncbi:uncharacterized protein MELLADRAFT_115467 [Melampsora larici-populina 98AG31]|uniref:Fe2OG dioxygenase domain-containing protein n=1 Tax=Melampsora larici-populina (strain 98AG31 / pathotype 3-4-7) TaxID=747676 RepID=F4RAV1_MELLP|nr:uncharacterized protein MELLADRAFT_115467 [Melampsora larici-populina 98AG31]EGG10714.1 hypothetical protein MELLADRAFT_115467 [Melampsora larici-populina 98AG31]